MVQIVSQDVHGQGRHGYVTLSTDMALLGISRVKASVSLLVPRQIGTCGIVLATLCTDIFVSLLGQATSILALLGSTINNGK